MRKILWILVPLSCAVLIGLFVYRNQFSPEAVDEGESRGGATPASRVFTDTPGDSTTPAAGNSGSRDQMQLGKGDAEPGDPQDHPLDEVLELAESIRQNIANKINDYTAVLVRRERVGGTLQPEQRMRMKVRHPYERDGERVPLSVYLKFLSPRSVMGREVIWVAGRNDGKLIAHEGGFKNLLRVRLDPEGMLAMRGNKYPISEVGLLRLAEKLIEKGERDRELGESEVRVVEEQMVGDRPCRLIQVTHPEPAKGFDFHVAQVFVDMERQVPLRYAAFMWPEEEGESPPLEEEYTYLELELNVGLNDADFDPDNSDYDYP